MSYERIALDAWNKNRLFSATLELTYRCNLDCHYCYNDKNRTGRAMDLADYQRLLADLADLNVLNLTLTGGEPLVHPDFFSIGSCAREHGFATRIKSNGHAIGSKLAKRIKRQIAPHSIEVSLHGATPETHDKQTRAPGSFQVLLRNISFMLDAGLRVVVNGTLTRWNEDELPRMYDLVEELGLPLMNLALDVTIKDDGDDSPLRIAASPQGAAAAQAERLKRNPNSAEWRLSELGNSRRNTNKQCGTGASTAVIDPYGEVYPCMKWRKRVGNVLTDSIGTIWESSPVLVEIRDASMKAKTFVDTHALPAFCIAQSLQETGKLLSVYPSLDRLTKTTKSVIKP